jgi:hypothetical protein
MFKWIKMAGMATGGVILVGGLVFGTDLGSYLTSSARSVRTSVRDAVPLDFELRRARDLIDDIIPEMHANIRLIAQEEVEINGLESEIQTQSESLAQEQGRVRHVRAMLENQEVAFGGRSSDEKRRRLNEELAGRFGHVKEASLNLAGKERLLEARRKSLTGAMDTLERTRARKQQLQDRVAGLEGQFRLVKAASVGSRVQMDNSKLAQAESLIGQIKKRLDVAERVLAHEARFVHTIPVTPIQETDLLAEVDEYLAEQDGFPSALPPDVSAPLRSTAMAIE